MSTRCATIVLQDTTWPEMEPMTDEVMRLYRHSDGYPECHGAALASSMDEVDGRYDQHMWFTEFVRALLGHDHGDIQFEPMTCEHSDIEFLYVVRKTIDYKGGGIVPATLEVYQVSFDDRSYDETMKRGPMFSGTAIEFLGDFLASSR